MVVVPFLAIALLAAPPEPLAAWKRASGGGAWDAVRTLHVVSTLDEGGLQGTKEEWNDLATGRYSIRYELGPLSGADGFDGREVWTADESGRSWIVGDRNSGEAAADAAFRAALGYWYPDRRGARVERAGQAIRITPSGGRPFQLWLDAATHLPSKIEEAGDPTVTTTVFGDYRKVGDLRLPFRIRQGAGREEFDEEVRVQRYEVNAEPPPGIFDIPRRPVTDLHLEKSTTVPLTIAEGELMVPIWINGEGPYDAILDTGAAAAMSPDVAKEVGVKAVGAVEGIGSGGSFAQGFGRAEKLQVGDAVLDRPIFAVRENPAFPRQIIIGHELFQRLVITVDPEKGTVTLTRPEAFTPAGKPLVLPFRFQERMPQVDASVEGTTGTFCVDTGQNIPIDLNYPFVEAHHLAEKLNAHIPAKSVGAGGLTNAKLYARIGSATVAGTDVRGILATIATGASASSSQSRYLAGCFGSGFLKRFRTTFDYARMRILLEPNASFDKADGFSRSGLGLMPAGKVWTVTSVYDESPAEDAALRVGMMVTAVDGKGPDQRSVNQLREHFRQAVGTKVTLTVREGEKERPVVLTLRDLL